MSKAANGTPVDVQDARARAPLALPDATALQMPSRVATDLATIHVRLNDEQKASLGTYLAHLIAMNERMNLTAITDPEEGWNKHIFDALTVVPHLPLGAKQLIDVGTGGGLPGVPLAIARPDIRVTLLDATQKKIDFLKLLAAKLGLSNVTAEAGRAEATQKSKQGSGYDVVTARAVARLDKLLSWTAPFARPGGTLVLIKGQQAEVELEEAKAELKRFLLTHEQTVPTRTGRILVLKKQG